jgi:molybdenum ABC transporter molybdate-binding protein
MRLSIVGWITMLVLLPLLVACAPESKIPAAPALVVSSAAGIQPALDAVIADYQKEIGARVEVQYGGSGQLLSSLMVAPHGDLFLAADESYIKLGREKGLIAEAIPLGTMRPVILAAEGNPKHITDLADLLKPDIRVALANPDQAAIGRSLKQLLNKTGQWEPLVAHARVLKPTVNDLANDVKIGSVDAAIVWDATAKQYPNLTVIHSATLDQGVERITIGVLKSCSRPQEALKFARYLGASDRGLETFKKLGYEPVNGDKWAAQPTLTLYCGALNRVAVKDTIAAFEAREDCRVTTVYNGCGILVAQMKAGQVPDAYLACDRSFVPPVANLFGEPVTISQVAIIIAVPKGNPKGIGTPEDLTRDGIKLGLCHPEQSSIGALTKKMFDPSGLYERLQPNVKATSATADVLVNQVLLGSLDACIVSEGNVSQVVDKLDIIRMPGASAIQPFTIARASENANLAGRLLAALTSDESRRIYEARRFTFLAGAATASAPATQSQEVGR